MPSPQLYRPPLDEFFPRLYCPGRFPQALDLLVVVQRAVVDAFILDARVLERQVAQEVGAERSQPGYLGAFALQQLVLNPTGDELYRCFEFDIGNRGVFRRQLRYDVALQRRPAFGHGVPLARFVTILRILFPLQFVRYTHDRPPFYQ